MKIIKQYLEHLSKNSESIFPMDSISTSKKPLNVPVHESEDESEKKVLIDLDGTIHAYSKGWDDGTMYDKPNDGSIEFINELKNRGYTVIIYTARIEKDDDEREEQIKKVNEWLKKYNIPYDGITSRKVPAIAYIDDRGIEFRDNNWNECLNKVEKLNKTIL